VRLKLLRLALAGQPGCEIDEQELARGGISYTVETVRDYARRFPGAELFYLIGADHAALLSKWRDAAELAGLAEFVVLPRPGQSPSLPPPPFRSCQLQGFPTAISASQIRDRVRAGLPVDLLTMPAVAEAIRDYRLYL
jgi:nicotinate-nucleotide adenylyltransferase